MRAIVTGSRYWNCYDWAKSVLAHLKVGHGDELVLVHGAAPGVDSAFANVAAEYGIRVDPYPADWDKLGNIAGPIRNEAMIRDGGDWLLALHPSLRKSKGTKDCLARAIRAGIPAYLIEKEWYQSGVLLEADPIKKISYTPRDLSRYEHEIESQRHANTQTSEGE